jgi:hypothetical protein
MRRNMHEKMPITLETNQKGIFGFDPFFKALSQDIDN